VAQIVSIQVGLPKLLGVEGAANPMDCPWNWVFKESVTGPVWLGQNNLVGDDRLI